MPKKTLILSALAGLGLAVLAAAPGSAAPAVSDTAPQTPRIRLCNEALAENMTSMGFGPARGLYAECLAVQTVEVEAPKTRKARPVREASLVCHTYPVGFGYASATRVCLNSVVRK